MLKDILAIGNSRIYDMEYFNLVLDYIKLNGKDAVLYKQDKCLNGEYIDFHVKSNAHQTNIIVDNNHYNIENFRSVWYLKPYLPSELICYPVVEYREFIKKQFKDSRESLFNLLSHKKWLPNPHKMFEFSNKVTQLNLATKCGFDIPNTLVTSNPITAKKFIAENDEVIVKQLASNISLFVDKTIFSNILKHEDVEEIDSLKLAPCIFQEYIEKEFEMRVTYINGKIFAVKIDSQKDKNTRIDWRKKPHEKSILIEPCILDIETQNKIYKFMKMSNLNFGCFDFIMATNRKTYFLEINPNGQWYFLDENTRHGIAFEIADYLCSN